MSIDRARALKDAQKYLAKGQLDRAIVEYEKMVAADPGDARSLLKLGDLYTRKGDNKGASATYRKVAARYADEGFFLKAVAVYKQILKLDPSDLPATEALAEMYEKLSLASDATATYEQVADAYLHAGKSDKALRALGKLTELDPSNVPGFVRYAEALSKANRIDEAAEAFARAADLLQQAGRVDDYIKVSERLLFHSHEDVARARDLASLYIERGQAKAALTHLQTAFKADPKSVPTLELLARAFRALGQDPKATSVYREIARVHAAEQRFTEEAAALTALLEIEPNDMEAQQRLDALGASQVEAEGDAVHVIEDDEFDEVVIVDDEPSRAAATPIATPLSDADRAQQIARLMAECEVFLRYGLRDKVVAQLNRVLDLDPHHVDARERLKAAHLKRGEVDEAVTQLLILSEAVASGDPARAIAYLQEAATLSPGNEAVGARLNELQSSGAFGSVADDDDVIIVDDDETEDMFGDADTETGFDPNARPALGPRETSLATALEGSDEPELVFEEGEDEDELGEAAGDDGFARRESQRVTVERVAPALEEAGLAAGADEEAAVEIGEGGDDELPEEIVEALEEADFYLQQQLAGEARQVLDDALESFPDHPALLAKLRELAPAAPLSAAQPQKPAVGLPKPIFAPLAAPLPVAPAASPARAVPAPAIKPAAPPIAAPAAAAPAEDRSFAMAQKLASQAESGAQGPVDVEQVLQQFKEGVKRQVDKADAATHYDLGIAYMEMGLHAEAIEEFKLCLDQPGKQCTSNTMIGLSYVSKGEMESAITHFKLALVAGDRQPDQELGLWFEIGNAYELLGKASEALIWYEKVEEQDAGFRDVAARMERLGVKKTQQQEVDEIDAMFDNMISKE
jgi:tetratricopeptide (TPR) repeat protein